MEAIIGRIERELGEIEERREKLIKESRTVLSHVRRAISSIHTGDLERAESFLKEVEKLLRELRKVAKEDLRKYIVPAEGEYVEAVCLKRLIEGGEIPWPEEVDVQYTSYLHGLLDCVGELRRCVLDQLKEGKFDRSVKLFQIMEAIYSALLPLSIYDNLIQGLRRKIDVARMQVEETRSLLVEEASRRRLIEEISKLEQSRG